MLENSRAIQEGWVYNSVYNMRGLGQKTKKKKMIIIICFYCGKNKIYKILWPISSYLRQLHNQLTHI